MKKPYLLLITGESDNEITDFAWELSQSMIPGTYLLFDGYSADVITQILQDLYVNDPVLRVLIFSTSDPGALESVKLFPYRVSHLTLNP